MKRKILGILVCTLLIATAVLPASEIGKESNADDGQSALMEFNPIVSDNLEMAVDASDYTVSDDLDVAIDASNSGEITCMNDVFHIYEGLHWKLYVTAYWDPPQERSICLWVDPATLPEGATFDPCHCAIDIVTSTLDWTPYIGQAGTYYITFYVGESCYEPIGYFTVIVIVYPLDLEPQQTFEIYVGQEWHLELTAYWVPPQPSKLICLWVDTSTLPYGATFTPCHCDYGEVTSDLYWTPTSDQVGEYIIIPLIGDACGYYIYPWPIEVIVYLLEGLHIDSKFQPEQVVYQHDILYLPDDLTGGPCEYNAALGMVTGKNTYLFGHPYSDRFEIKMTCCNNYNHPVTFQWVLKIFPDGKEIWRSETVTVPAKTTKTFTYAAPLTCPGTPFQWNRWDDDAETKPGYIELSIDPDHTGGSSPCNCQTVKVNVVLHKTHDLDVLFVPFTFGDGPDFPADLANIASATAFDTWRWDTLEPWWNAIYPLRENGLDTDRNWLGNIQKNLTTRNTNKVVSDLASYQALTEAEAHDILNQLFEGAAALGWMRQGVPGGYDRIIWLMDPDVLAHPWGAAAGWAYQCPPNAIKQGVLVDWNARWGIAAHEVGHTYGLSDNYVTNAAGALTNRGDHAVGYWVNENRDVLPAAWDLMAAVWEIWGAERTWIKKPNFIELLERFTNQRDPEILGISGYIDKNDNVELNPWYKLDQGYVDLEWGTTGIYILKAYDNNGLLLNEAGFNISFNIITDYLNERPINESLFSFRVEWIDDIKRIDIVNSTSNEIIATRIISSNSPQITITSPSPGEQIKQGICEIIWNGNDNDGDTLVYAVFISNDSGINWYIIDFDNSGNSFMADFTNFPKGDYQIKVIASDGWNVCEETTNFGIKYKVKTIFLEPHINTPFINFLENLLENHPRMFPLLQKLLILQ